VLTSALLANVDNLRFLGHDETNRNHEMDCEIVGNRAFIACGASQGVEAYDISNPQSPVYSWRSNGPNCWRTQSYGESLLFAFCRREGVVLFDINGTPALLGQYNPPGNREALEGGALVGSTLYTAAHQNGIYVIDVSNPASPQKTGALSLAPDAAAWNVLARDSFLFIANGRHGLAVAGTAGGLHLVTRLELPGTATDLVLKDNTLVMSLGVAGLATVSVADPRNPVLLDTAGTAGCTWGIGIAGNLVVSGSWRVLELFDIANPSAVSRVGWDNTLTWAHGADIRGDSVIAVADWRGMSCYRVGADPGADIDVNPELLDFGQIPVSRETTLTVRNTGSAALSVTSTNVPSGIAASPASFSVPAGDSQLVRITASGSGQLNGNVRFNSNDPDEAQKTFEVYKNNTAFPQYLSLAPNFSLTGTDGQTHTLSGNRGKVVYLQFGASW